MKIILTRAQAHAMVIQRQAHHPDCLDSKDKWDSYDKPFSWDIVKWCKYSDEAIRCTGIAQCINGIFIKHKISKKQTEEIWKGFNQLIEMLNDKKEIE